jgi:hypothetical protein
VFKTVGLTPPTPTSAERFMVCLILKLMAIILLNREKSSSIKTIAPRPR